MFETIKKLKREALCALGGAAVGFAACAWLILVQGEAIGTATMGFGARLINASVVPEISSSAAGTSVAPVALPLERKAASKSARVEGIARR